MAIWHWVRHGPTHEKTFVGWRDVPADLSDTAQIARLRAHLPQSGLLISSDLIRCVATADAIESNDHTRLPHAPGLRELNFGIWDGMHFSDVAEQYPDTSFAYWDNPGDVIAPDGESWNQAAARVNAEVDRINAAHPEEEIIAVAHFGVILMQIQRAKGVTPKEAISRKIDNLSVTSISKTAEPWDILTINHVP